MVTLFTTRFNIKKSYILLTNDICMFWILEKTAIISLHSTNSLVFITETACVYRAVRTGSLNVTDVYVTLIWLYNSQIFEIVHILERYIYAINIAFSQLQLQDTNIAPLSLPLKNFLVSSFLLWT